MTTLETMYNGVAGSPETIITAQYVAGTTATITVADASVLPAAPNRVVLQRVSDLGFVTVFYGTLVGNVLGVLTPEAGLTTGTFPVGSTAARRFTEGDHKELRDNITALNSDKLDILQGLDLVFVTDTVSGEIITVPRKSAFNSDIATATPLMAGTATVGVSAKLAKEDHVHPTDTTRAPLDVATISADGLMSSEDKVILDGHVANVTTNPHNVTKTNVGLGNCDNTSDANKPVSTAQATAIGLKVDIAQGIGNASKIVITDASGNVTTLAKKTAFNSDLATATPLMDGNAEVGTSVKLAKEDHRHPRDSVLQSQIDFLNTLNSPIIGVQWDTNSTSPTLTWIDETGATITGLNTAWFDKHILWGGRWRCVRNRTTGAYTFGTNPRGDGLVLDGTAGDVVVTEPIAYVKADYGVAGAGIARYWVSPRPAAGFVVHPHWMQRNNGIATPTVCTGAYESYGYLDGSTFKLGSASGKVPITGGVAYPNLPNTGRFNISDAETYANNITGTIRSGCENVWNNCATQLLMYIEFGTLDIQTALGKGVVDLDSGTGFAGKNTGADSIDSRLAENGTGTGSGTNGQTPICWRGKENPWGNCYKYNIGANFYLDGSVRLLKRDGTGTPSATLAAGSYDTVTGPVGLTSGYISATLQDDVSNIAFLPASVTGGGSGYYLCDYYNPVTVNGNIMRSGGNWNTGLFAGPGNLVLVDSTISSDRRVSARIEFYPEGGKV